MNKILVLTFLLFLLKPNEACLQDNISLDQVLDLVLKNSFAKKQADNLVEISLWENKLFESQLKPFVSLSANLPQYIKTSSPIIQPDGTISFQSIRQANSAISAYASQVVASTGGLIFVESNLRRFDDFSSSLRQHNGIPIRLGIQQPLFTYNPWKFQKAIQPLRLALAQKQYNLILETAFVEATSLYFNIIIANENLEIAKVNKESNEKLLVITEERLKLGKVSRDEKIQLEIELNSAKLALSQATLQVEQAQNNLEVFLGKEVALSSKDFIIPEDKEASTINYDALINSFKSIRPELLENEIALKELEDEMSKTKVEYGFQAQLQASIGLARGAEKISPIYTDPFDEQQFNVSVSVPVLDWGRRKAALKQIELRKENLKDSFQQQVLELENDLLQKGNAILRLQNELKILKEIMTQAEERFRISNERYVLGDLDITNLTFAQRDKDQAKRNYVNALRFYWLNYYELRAISGYDVFKNEKIIYN